MLESGVEKPFVKFVQENGDLCLKLNVVGRRGYPDRLVLLSEGGWFLIELKRPGERLRKLQKHIHKKLRKLGHVVHWSDNYEKAINIYKEEKYIQSPYTK